MSKPCTKPRFEPKIAFIDMSCQQVIQLFSTLSLDLSNRYLKQGNSESSICEPLMDYKLKEVLDENQTYRVTGQKIFTFHRVLHMYLETVDRSDRPYSDLCTVNDLLCCLVKSLFDPKEPCIHNVKRKFTTVYITNKKRNNIPTTRENVEFINRVSHIGETNKKSDII